MARGTYDFEVPALVRCSLGTLEGSYEVERRVVYQLYPDLRRLVILAIWFGMAARGSAPSDALPRKRFYIPEISLFTLRSLASMMYVDGRS